jgi:hypothetical protein
MYLLAELNWDPDIDLGKTAGDYNRDFYGSGEEPGSIISELRAILDSEKADENVIGVLETFRDKLKELEIKADNDNKKECLERFVLYLEYLLLRKQFNYLKTREDCKQQATACLRRLFNFYNENQSKIQPYYEIIDLIVKKNFEFK